MYDAHGKSLACASCLYSCTGSRKVESAHGAGTGGELVDGEAHALQHAQVEIWQRVVLLIVERKVARVFEAAAQ